MPRPSSPTMLPQASRYSISAEALERLPHLSLSRWISSRLRLPSGSQPGTAKHDTPASVRASVKNRSLCGTEKNHLCPVMRYAAPGPPAPSGTAVVCVARRSEPPCFSVIAMPTVAPVLSGAGPWRRS